MRNSRTRCYIKDGRTENPAPTFLLPTLVFCILATRNLHLTHSHLSTTHKMMHLSPLPIPAQASALPSQNPSRTLVAASGHSINTLVGSQVYPFSKALHTSNFDVIRVLGQGSFGTVFEVELKANQQRYALKAIKKETQGFAESLVKREKDLMEWLAEDQEKLALRLHASWQDAKNVYLLTVRFQ